jgi:hypothetical protein
MAHQNIWKICNGCHGRGTEHPIPVYDEEGNKIGEEEATCPKCDGTGRLMWGYLDK